MSVNYQNIENQLSLVRRVVFKNLLKDYMPLPVDKSLCTKWTQELPRSGDTIIYTSYMYQLGSLFKSYAKLLEKFSGVKMASNFAFLGRALVKPNKEELQRAFAILNNIARLLKKSGVEFGYLYDEEPYSGALLLELGLLDEFQTYGKKVFELFDSKGVRRIITVDPHTMNAMARIKEMLNSDIEVVNYLQLIHSTNGRGKFVMHDSCLYSRYLGLGGSIREMVLKSGVTLAEDRMVTAPDTSMCCGAPVESLSQQLSESIAKMRGSQLNSVFDDVLVACPLCYQNLSPYVRSIHDVAEVIA